MGSRGPVPKQAATRRRRNKDVAHASRSPAGQPAALPSTAAAPARSKLQRPNHLWHPVAKDWFSTLWESGQARFYEPSDWAVARFVAEAMSRCLRAERTSAQMVATVLGGAADLMSTESSRRRLRLELTRHEDDENQPGLMPVAALDEYRHRLGAG